ncbi:phage holin, LLH family [Limosilactobacillus vaginalis]|uniref:phage holin, LLH family n=1 Tax=Limosilactobacillus vaginalis TaxID=1633 RepID=UPI003F1EB6FF
MEIINAIPSYLITVTASVAFFIALNILQNFIHTKIVHAKTETSRARWAYVGQLADTAVASLSGRDIAGHEKFEQATDFVQKTLEKQGIKNIDLNAIETAVQSAYEKADLKTKKPVIKSVVKATPQEITTSIASPQANLKDMPGASKKAETKPYSPETAKSIKGIPTGNLEDIAVQAPKKEEGADNGN